MASSNTNQTKLRQAREVVVGIARGILNGTVGIVEGSRMLLTIHRAARVEHDADFIFFVGVDSLTEHLPVGNVRRHWNLEALRMKDAELNEFESQVRARAYQVCSRLVERYSNAA